MWTLGNLSADIAACISNTHAGIGHIAYWVNLQDINKITTVVNNYGITTLNYNTGTTALEVALLNTDEPDGNVKLVRGQYRDGWDSNFTIRLFVNDEASRVKLNELKTSRGCLLYQLHGTSGFYWEIAGYELGLEVKSIERSYNDLDNSGGWVVSLGCDDTYKEKDMPYVIGTPPASYIVPTSGVSHIDKEITEVDVIDGLLNLATPIQISNPIGFYLHSNTGMVSRYDVKKINTQLFEINIGEQLPAGTYQTQLLYVN